MGRIWCYEQELAGDNHRTVSRNPIFIFIDIYFIGTFLINETLIFLIFAALAVIGMHYQIMQEEKFLAKAYGQVYKDYCARTGRYVGWRRQASSPV
jgi:protein-S-isoprenylcysteine O-methyltransferase Ste14